MKWMLFPRTAAARSSAEVASIVFQDVDRRDHQSEPVRTSRRPSFMTISCHLSGLQTTLGSPRFYHPTYTLFISPSLHFSHFLGDVFLFYNRGK